ncbi:MAG: radical SAM protein, partial [Candidatus Omnitrophica bacterium]|nr:radical SAM protein [Candidatus Omnitrophota bacterium]
TPVYPLSPLQRGLYLDAMVAVKDMFPDLNLPIVIKDDTIYVGYDELIAAGDRMCSAGIDDNERFFNDRVLTVEKFLKLAQDFEVTNDKVQEFFDVYTHMITHFHLRAGFRRRAALFLRERMIQSLPQEVRNLVMHLISMNAPMEWSGTRERDLDYRRLLYGLRAEEKKLLLSGKKAPRILTLMRDEQQGLFEKITVFLMRYRVERYQKDDWNAPLPYNLIIAQMIDDLGKGLDREPVGPQILRPLEGFEAFLRTLEGPIKKYDPSFDFNSFLRILILSERQTAQVDNERHWQHRYQAIIRAKLIAFGEKLVGKGLLRSPEQILMKGKDEFLDLLKTCEQGGTQSRQVSDNSVLEQALLRPQVDYVELHPTNRCNLCKEPCCKGFCTYETRHKGKETFPFEHLEDVAKLRPSYVFIVGGGEPTMYNDKGKSLPDLIVKLRKLLPQATIVLVTNGVKYIDGDWQKELSSIRVSFHGYKKSDFEKSEPWHVMKTWENIGNYFKGPIGEVWVTFRFTRDNYLEIPALAEMLWEQWRTMCKKDPRLKKKEFGFKMLYTADDSSHSDPYRLSNPDDRMQKQWAAACAAIKESGRPFGDFLKELAEGHLTTNFSLPKELITGTLIAKEAPPAERCLLAADYALIGADAKTYPCCIMAVTEQLSLGNITQSPEDLLSARRQLFRCPHPDCKTGCRMRNTVMGALVDKKLQAIERGGPYDAASRYDTGHAVSLLSDLIYTELQQDRVYEIKYDIARLTVSQVDVIEAYIGLLKARCSDPDNIRPRPFSGTNGAGDSLIAVYCTGKGFRGEGHVDVTIPEGDMKNYLLRITGMLNIALASSNIPDDLSPENVDTYRPLMGYINDQYKTILGGEIVIPDSPADILKVMRNIVLDLPKSMRADIRRIEEYDRLARQALISA